MDNKEFMQGTFGESLLRSSTKIKQDRARLLYENAEMAYRREIEDLERAIRTRESDQGSLIDLSPTDANSLILSKDFDPKAFYKQDMKLALEIKDLKDELEVARERYQELFKRKPEPETATA